MNLRKLIKTFEILNIDESESTIPSSSIYRRSKQNGANAYIVSDADEELMILIEFKQKINLRAIIVYASADHPSDEASPPKQLKMYKTNNINYNFDDIASLKADKSVICYPESMAHGQAIDLTKKLKNPLKFKKVTHLVVYINANQDDTELTFLNGISFFGDCGDDEKDDGMNDLSALASPAKDNTHRPLTSEDLKSGFDYTCPNCGTDNHFYGKLEDPKKYKQKQKCKKCGRLVMSHGIVLDYKRQ